MVHQISREQFLHSNIDDIWNFVSSPQNLKIITPKYMNFHITSKNLPQKMYPGMIITYKVSPIFKIRMHWVTEITQVKEKYFFIDEQKYGPYTIWHHQHFFEIKENGVLMRDIVTYKLPFGFFGIVLNKLFIQKKINSIFDYRFEVLDKIFNK